MGWTFMNRPKGHTDREWFSRQWGEEFSKRIVETATKGGVFYAALESTDDRLVPDENGKVVVAIVCLTKWVPKDYYNWGYKDMDEFMGPCEANCPEKVLKLLSPFKPDALAKAAADYEEKKAQVAAGTLKYAYPDSIIHAHEWRERCWDVIKAAKALKAAKPGTVFKRGSLIRFTDGVQTDTLVLAERRKSQLIWMRPDGMRVNLTKRVTSELRPV